MICAYNRLRVHVGGDFLYLDPPYQKIRRLSQTQPPMMVPQDNAIGCSYFSVLIPSSLLSAASPAAASSFLPVSSSWLLLRRWRISFLFRTFLPPFPNSFWLLYLVVSWV